ncbi:MAG: RNA polymerase subunit sigma, partial [Myxococcales bacterium]|nr:RNA polymerase subunit sigma [Myxococcales bacterium]
MTQAQQSEEVQPVSDEALLSLVEQGDESAFEELVRRYRDRVYRLSMGMLKNSAEAEETC